MKLISFLLAEKISKILHVDFLNDVSENVMYIKMLATRIVIGCNA